MHDVDFAAPTSPFSDLPDPRFTYRHGSFQAVCADLLYARLSERPGLIVIAGPEGSGKTTLLEVLMDERTSADRYHCLSAHRTMTFKTILEQTAKAFGIVDDVADVGKTFGEDLTGLGVFLNEAGRGGGKVILMIDRAETLSEPVLRKMAELSRLEQGEGKLLQIVMAVTLEDDRLPAAFQVANDSIAFETRLEPLDGEEVGAYIAHRLSMAGHDDSMPFTDEALAALSHYSAGLPARINRLCRTALQICQARFATMADADMIAEAAAACGIETNDNEDDKAPRRPSDLELIEEALGEGKPPHAAVPDWDVSLDEDLPPLPEGDEDIDGERGDEAAATEAAIREHLIGGEGIGAGEDEHDDGPVERDLPSFWSDLGPPPGPFTEGDAVDAGETGKVTWRVDWARFKRGLVRDASLWRMRAAAVALVLVLGGAIAYFGGRDAEDPIPAIADVQGVVEPAPLPELEDGPGPEALPSAAPGQTGSEELAALAAKVEALSARMAELQAEGARAEAGGGNTLTPPELDDRLVRLEEANRQIAAALEEMRAAAPAEAGSGGSDEASSDPVSNAVALEADPLLLAMPENPEDLLPPIQEALIEFGFQVGETDGGLGDNIEKSIEQYQASQGLKVTGEPSRALLKHLNIYRSLRMAIDHYHRGDVAGALRIYDGIVAVQPHDPDARLFRGLLRAELGQVEEALTDLAVDPGPSADPTVAYFKPARVYYIQERLKALGFDPGRYDGLLTDGTKKAIKLYQHLQELPITGEPTAALLKHIEVYGRHLAAVDAYQDGDHLKAVELYDLVLRMDHDDANAYFNRGLAYRALGQLDQALADYDMALRYAPDTAKIYYDRGKIHWELGEYSAAVTDYWSAVTMGLF